MSNDANFASTPKNGTLALTSVANTALDGTGTLATIFTAGTKGARLDVLNVQALNTTTAGMIRLFLTVGGTTRLLREIPVSAATPSATVQAFSADVPLGLVMEPGAILKASTHNAESFAIVPTVCGDF